MRKKVLIRKTIQKRAEDLKSLQEQRADKIQQMKDLSDTAETEKRAFSYPYPPKSVAYDSRSRSSDMKYLQDALQRPPRRNSSQRMGKETSSASSRYSPATSNHISNVRNVSAMIS